MKWSYNVTTIAKGKLQIPASHKIVAFRIISGRRIVETVTLPLSRIPWRLRIKLQTGGGFWGARYGAVLRALASHQCGPGSNPGVDAIFGLTFAREVFLRVLRFSPLLRSNISKFQFDQ